MQTCVFKCLLNRPTCMSKGISNLKYLTTPMLPHLFPISSSVLHFPINANSIFSNAQTTLFEVILDSSFIHTQHPIYQQVLSTQTSVYMWNHQASSPTLSQPDASPLLSQLNCRNCLSTHLLFLPCPSVPYQHSYWHFVKIIVCCKMFSIPNLQLLCQPISPHLCVCIHMHLLTSR